jgi:ferredoxin
VLHRLRRLACLRRILSRGRLYFWVPDEDHPPFGRIQIDPILCIGCKKCLSKGPDGCFLDGCPWDAIAMVDTVEVEREVGPMAI